MKSYYVWFGFKCYKYKTITMNRIVKSVNRLQVKTVVRPASVWSLQLEQTGSHPFPVHEKHTDQTRQQPTSSWDAHSVYKRHPEHESASLGRSITGAQTYLRLWIEGTMVACVLSQSCLCRLRWLPTTNLHGAEVEISHTGLLFPFSETTLFISSLIATAL